MPYNNIILSNLKNLATFTLDIIPKNTRKSKIGAEKRQKGQKRHSVPRNGQKIDRKIWNTQ